MEHCGKVIENSDKLYKSCGDYRLNRHQNCMNINVIFTLLSLTEEVGVIDVALLNNRMRGQWHVPLI